MKKILLLAFVSVLFSIAIVWGFIGPIVGRTNKSNSSSGEGKFVFANSKTIWVPDNFTTIQEAINNASDGDTIFVRADTYYENVVVNKRVSLIGENKCNTIIDGNGTGSVIYVTANNVNVTGFTLQNGGSEFPDSGILLSNSDSSCIKQNIVMNNKFGILLLSSSDNNLVDNIVSNNLHGIELYVNSNGNALINNIASNNHAGIYLANSDGNTLVDNTGSDNNFGIVLGWSNDNILIDNTVSNSGWTGIRIVDDSNGNVLINNTASNNLDGFELTYANDNTLVNNFASHNRRYGIQVAYSNSNVFVSNEVSNNVYGIRVSESSSNNTIYHNNFINNTWQAYILPLPLNTMWDNGYPSGGNYWSDYTGVDLYGDPNQNETGSDGVGDKSYVINTDNTDRYPLMGPISFFNAGTWDETTYYIHIVSNSTISDFYFSGDNKLVSFNVTGPDDTTGFCRVTIPKELLWCDNPEQWQVLVNNTLIEDRKIMEDIDYTYIYFTYNHTILNVQITYVQVAPEFPTWTSILLILIMLTIAIAIYKRRLLKTPIH